MKRKLSLLIVTCSIVLSIIAPIPEPVADINVANPPIMKVTDHGLGT